MVIIIDNKDGENVDAILPGDDGYGYKINIPVVLIRKTDGDNLLKILQSSDNKTATSLSI